jgi:PAS domain S-box-containing protein
MYNHLSAQFPDVYRTILNSTDQGFCILELHFNQHQEPINYRLIDHNPAFEAQSGLKDALGKTILELVPNLESFWLETFGRVALSGEAVSFENDSLLTGQWFTVNAFRIGQPQDRHVALLFRDITERKREEANLLFLDELSADFARLSTADEIMLIIGEKVGAFLKLTTCLFIDVDLPKGEVTTVHAWNSTQVPNLRQTFRLEDYLTEEFVRAGRAGEKVIVADTQKDPRTDAAAYAALQIGSFVTVPFHRDGEWKSYIAVTDSSARQWRQDELELIGELANRLFPRIERARTLEALQESEERFRIMADAAPNIVWALYPDGSQRYLNKYGQAYLGVSLEEVVALNWTPFIHPQDLEATSQAVGQAIENRQAYSQELRLRRHDGVYRWYLSQGAPSYYASGELYGYVGSGIDITDLKQANELLVRTNNELDNFIYAASHDLKSPITNIEGLLTSLLRHLPSESAASERIGRITGLMQESIERFKKTIRDLTDVARLGKEDSWEVDPVDVGKIIREVQLDLEPMITACRAQVVLNIGQSQAVHFSEKNLRSLIYNLFSNALKYRSLQEVPRVEIECVSGGEYHVLTVRDNGLGMESQQIDQLFTIFKRFHTHVEGSGVGLYMVKKMVENAGGKIEVESQVGQGTVFRVFLKKHDPHPSKR